MSGFTLRFRGKDATETLAHASAFFEHGGAELEVSREEFFARLVLDDDGKQAVVFLGGELPLHEADAPASADEG